MVLPISLRLSGTLFQFDSGDGRAKLTLQGPKVPGIGVAPAIGVSRDAKGNYHFLIGGGEFFART